MEAALSLCEWKLKHNIKTAAFERLSKLLKKHMLPTEGRVSRHAIIKSGEKRNKKVLIIIPWPFAPKHSDIYVEETLKAIVITQSAEVALIVQDVYEVIDNDGNKSKACRDL
eukprot:jgi/Tetstr1/461835/TSEL_006914.t1